MFKVVGLSGEVHVSGVAFSDVTSGGTHDSGAELSERKLSSSNGDAHVWGGASPLSYAKSAMPLVALSTFPAKGRVDEYCCCWSCTATPLYEFKFGDVRAGILARLRWSCPIAAI